VSRAERLRDLDDYVFLQAQAEMPQGSSRDEVEQYINELSNVELLALIARASGE